MLKARNDTCRVVCTDREEEIKDFKRWRNYTLQKAVKNCKSMSAKTLNDNPELIQAIVYTPKCLIKYTKYLCESEKKCYKNLLADLKFDNDCFLFDLNNLYADSNYVDCNFLDRNIVNSRFVGKNVEYDIYSIRHNIYNELNSIIKGTGSKNKLLYNLYCIRDVCRNDINCLKTFLNRDRICNCQNIKFPDNLKEIENIVFYSSSNNVTVRNKRSINELLKDGSMSSNSTGLLNNTSSLNLFGDHFNNSAVNFQGSISLFLIPMAVTSYNYKGLAFVMSSILALLSIAFNIKDE